MVALYDALNPRDASADFYAAFAGASPRRILDVGCGTGQLAVELAGRGHAVTAVDPAPAMLAVGRARDVAGAVAWVTGDARTLALAARFDAAVMTGNAFQIFVADDDAEAALATVRRHLARGGAFAFDARNPGARAWQGWHGATREVDAPGLGRVVVRHEVRDVAGGVVRFATHHALPTGEVVTSETALRFRSADALAALVRRAGFTAIAVSGDWDGGAVTEASREIVVVAR